MDGSARGAAGGTAGRYRWVICGLIFLAACLTYLDRQMFGLLKPTMQASLGWSELDYSGIVIAFHAAFVVGFLTFGPIMDRLGARRGYFIAFALWSVSHVAHGLAHTVGQFALARFALGVGESGTFPARLKAVAEWFPVRERALAIGLFNSGALTGACLTALIVPWVTAQWGWRAAFLITGLACPVWLLLWARLYRAPPVPPAEPPTIAQAAIPPNTLGLLRQKAMWAYIVVKFLTVPVWWLYLFWLPDFFYRSHGLDLSVYGAPLMAIFLLADLGSAAGGWMSSRLIRHGLSVGRARLGVMAGCAVLVLPLALVPFVSSLWLSLGLIAIAAASHQAFSANLLAFPSDLFPAAVVGRVAGIGGAAGAVGAIVMAAYSGVLLQTTGSYNWIFAAASTTYSLAVVLLLAFKVYAASSPSSCPKASRASRQRRLF